MQGFNVQFKSLLNQLSLSHESNKNMKREKQTMQLSQWNRLSGVLIESLKVQCYLSFE